MFDCYNLPHDLEALPHDEFDGCPIVLVSVAIQLTDYNVDTWFKKLKKTKFQNSQISFVLSLIKLFSI